MSEEIISDLKKYLINELLISQSTIRILLHKFEKDFNLPTGSGISMFYNLLINKGILINLNERINIDNIIHVSNGHN